MQKKLKLIIQIPCYNEAGTLWQVLDELPKEIPWIDSIEVLIIDDGSSDDTIAVAKAHGVKHILPFPANRGLGTAFRLGVAYSLSHGADIVVNTDADNQYPSKYIKDIVKPIIDGKADIVIGDRRPAKVKHFKRYKKIFQKLGNVVMTFFTGIAIPDAVSGFRAYSKESLEILNVTVRFSYVIDTILQAYKKWLHITWVPITTNLPTRPSRLFKNIWVHMKKSATSIVRVYTMYEPFKIFFSASIPFLIIGLSFVFRFMYFYLFTEIGAGKIQSLTIWGILTTIGCTFLSVGIIWDVVARNRILIEENLRLTKKLLYKDEDTR
jgi:glycosyltransferase involved in cell wall biosynthesis